METIRTVSFLKTLAGINADPNLCAISAGWTFQAKSGHIIRTSLFQGHRPETCASIRYAHPSAMRVHPSALEN